MIFVDTSAILALAIEGDEFHAEAVGWVTDEPLVTSNLVILEVLGWIRHRSGKKKAVELGKHLLIEHGLKIMRVTPRSETQAWELFCALEGRGVSMIDCTSMVMMKRLKIERVFAFDQDFAKAGFAVVP